jgi:hypothetical protein
MGWRRPFAVTALPAALCAPFALPAAAQAGWEYCVALDGKAAWFVETRPTCS